MVKNTKVTRLKGQHTKNSHYRKGKKLKVNRSKGQKDKGY